MAERGDFSDVAVPLVYAFLKAIEEGFIDLAFKVLFSHLFALLFALLILSLDLMVYDQLHFWDV